MRTLSTTLALLIVAAAAACDDGPECGDGTVDPGETCDGNCPTACDDAMTAKSLENYNPIVRFWLDRADDSSWSSQKFIDFVQRNPGL